MLTNPCGLYIYSNTSKPMQVIGLMWNTLMQVTTLYRYYMVFLNSHAYMYVSGLPNTIHAHLLYLYISWVIATVTV